MIDIVNGKLSNLMNIVKFTQKNLSSPLLDVLFTKIPSKSMKYTLEKMTNTPTPKYNPNIKFPSHNSSNFESSFKERATIKNNSDLVYSVKNVKLDLEKKLVDVRKIFPIYFVNFKEKTNLRKIMLS